MSDFCDPIDCSLPGSSVHGIFQARILEWVAMSISRGSSQPGFEPVSPVLQGRFLNTGLWGKPETLILLIVLYMKTKLLKGFNGRLASVVAQRVRNLPAMQDIWVRSLGQEDPLEKETATHSSILAWRIPLTEEPRSYLCPWGHKIQTQLSD